jgi:hypothetical protein
VIRLALNRLPVTKSAFSWSLALTLVALAVWEDTSFLPQLGAQLQAQRFQPIAVKIVKSSVGAEIVHNKQGKPSHNFWPEIEYAYQRSGKDYRSTRVRYLAVPSALAHKTAEQYPVDTNQTAYINPLRPDESVLLKAWIPADASLTLGLMGVNACALAAVLALKSCPTGQPVRQQNGRLYLMIQHSSPTTASFGCGGYLAAVFGLLHLKVWLIQSWLWFGILTLVLLLFVISQVSDCLKTNRDLSQALVLDPQEHTLSLGNQQWKWGDIKEIHLRQTVVRASNRDKKNELFLVLHGGQSHSLYEGVDSETIRRMAAWIKEQIQKHSKGSPPAE